MNDRSKHRHLNEERGTDINNNNEFQNEENEEFKYSSVYRNGHKHQNSNSSSKSVFNFRNIIIFISIILIILICSFKLLRKENEIKGVINDQEEDGEGDELNSLEEEVEDE